MLTNENGGLGEVGPKIDGPFMVWITLSGQTLFYVGYQDLRTGNPALNQSAAENAVGFWVLFLQDFNDVPRNF